jgi:poly(3-hydroxybutyrate) depolymerase
MRNTFRSIEPIVLREGWVIGGVSRGGRQAFDRDSVQAELVKNPLWMPSGADGWTPVTATDAAGTITDRALRGGAYFATQVNIPAETTMLLAAQGHGMVYVNGEPRTGDPYSYGSLVLPVRLRKGQNTFIFSVGRGRVAAQLLLMGKPITLYALDTTLPDVIIGEKEPLWGAVILVNATDKTQRGLKITAGIAGERAMETVVPPLLPYSIRKVGFRFAPPAVLPAGKDAVALELRLGEDSLTLNVRVRGALDSQRRTFVSAIDNSIQYYAAWPAQRSSARNAMVLTLHGASVEAQGQVQAYGAKDWATLVAPTNRRPYGFDWEDWGRLDALEVLEQGQKRFPHDPERVLLTGHSMGGHGTWSLGSLFPGKFAAIGPSAGWISFGTYAGSNTPSGAAGATESPVVNALRRAAGQSDTLLFKENLRRTGVYVLHGDADDNVPVTEARAMRAELASMKHAVVLAHEEPKAGHWWDDDETTPGAACVDWAPMFRLFQRSRLAYQPHEVSLVTVNPAVSSQNYWLTVVQQERSLEVSSANLVWNPLENTVVGTTTNVQCLTIEIPTVRTVTIDGQTLAVPTRGRVTTLAKQQGRWQLATKRKKAAKNPARSGPFKQAFQNRFVLVYGTHGTPEETGWGLAKTRYDAETFLYRGNGAPEVVADRDYDAKKMHGRNVILYGNADTNRLWSLLLKGSPITVRRGAVTVGKQVFTGDDLACLFLYPKPNTDDALVGVVAGTGMAGLRYTNRLPYFTSGVAYPDWVVAKTSVLTEGLTGVLGAGFFDNDWRIDL